MGCRHRFTGLLLFIVLLVVAPSSMAQLKDETVVSGLKEALLTGASKAVATVSRPDGFYKNDMIRILLPERMQRVADTLGRVGLQQQVDDLVLSMNRAAEAAAPQAGAIFVDAVRNMEFEDAFQILEGSETAATDYLKTKTSSHIYDEFKPIVAESMDQVGTRRLLDTVVNSYRNIPLVSKLAPLDSLDIDEYVTQNAIAGLFQMVAQEEQQIRKNPAARATDLLKAVFGK